MPKANSAKLPETLGELRASEQYSEQKLASRSVKDEIRSNLVAKLRDGETLFPGIVGYDDTVVPQIVNAVLSRHDFILLGLRGQAKSRILRQLTTLLDERLPYVAGTETHDNPYRPLSARGRELIAEQGDDTPIAWLERDDRYVEKLATPDVTIADMIGDIDPIKAVRGGRELGDELTMHFGLLPRANRGIFAINELPDLMGKIQVGLFNILQEGDVQIKGYPVRLPLDLLLVFSANPEDYTARGKIITPLKDRIGSEIRTHYPLTVEHGIQITQQEAWADRTESGEQLYVPGFVREMIEQIAFVAREDSKIDKRSGVSQRLPISVLENAVSNAERRALINGEDLIVPRVADIYAALPSITGKFELEYEGELRGAEKIAHELIRSAVARVFDESKFRGPGKQIVQWFELGGSLKLAEDESSDSVVEQLREIQGVMEVAESFVEEGRDQNPVWASAGELVLEGLHAHRRLNRSEEVGYSAEPKKPKKPSRRRDFAQDDFGDAPFN